jgi:hypothetical protein
MNLNNESKTSHNPCIHQTARSAAALTGKFLDAAGDAGRYKEDWNVHHGFSK